MEFDFHSSRAERLSQGSASTRKAYENRNKTGYFKKNPHMKILVIDLIIVLLFGVIIIPFLIKITQDIRFDDYKVTSKAIAFEENILVSVKINKLYKNVTNRKSSSTILITVSMEEYSISKEDILPTRNGDDKYITFKLDDNPQIEIINVSMSSGEFTKQIKINVDR